jgi:hypothetical protein
MCETQAAAEPDGGFDRFIAAWLTIRHNIFYGVLAILGRGALIDELIPRGVPSQSWNSENTLQNDTCFRNGLLHYIGHIHPFNNTFDSLNEVLLQQTCDPRY